MPTWTTPRRPGATAVLYAVFAGGWYLGQPLPGVGCHAPEPILASEGPDTIREPLDLPGDLSHTVRQVTTTNFLPTDALVACDGTDRPRLVAWATGDWS